MVNLKLPLVPRMDHNWLQKEGKWVPRKKVQLPHSQLPHNSFKMALSHVVYRGLPNPLPFVSTTTPFHSGFCRLG